MRNELFTRAIKFLERQTHHRGCEDGWYACPKSEEYIEHRDGEKRECNCGADEAKVLLEEITAEKVN